MDLLRHGTTLTPRTSRAVRAARAGAIAAVAALGMLIVVVAAGLPLYVFPPSDTVERADLIYVIGPPTPPRIEQAQLLEADGVAEELLVSVPSASDGGRYTAANLDACADDTTTCDTPSPFTTKGEALMLTEFEEASGAEEAVVITFTPHVARTRYIFDKCHDGAVTVVGVDQDLSLGDWVYQYAYQSAAFVKAWVTPCA